jgi:hypothetical protein
MVFIICHHDEFGINGSTGRDWLCSWINYSLCVCVIIAGSTWLTITGTTYIEFLLKNLIGFSFKLELWIRGEKGPLFKEKNWLQPPTKQRLSLPESVALPSA